MYDESELHSRLNPIRGRTNNRNQDFRKQILKVAIEVDQSTFTFCMYGPLGVIEASK